MRWGLVFWGLLILVAIAAIVALCLRPATVIGVSEKSLAYSVRGAADADVTGRCQGEDDEWVCTAVEGDRQIAYAIDVDDYGCWEGRRREGAGELPKALDGCITITDLIRTGD
jgi:hypothetical protein